MASKKTTTASKPATKAKIAPKVAIKASSTPVRNTPIPKAIAAAPASVIVAAVATPQLTHDAIAFRAYEIWSSAGGSEMDNWARAEAELRGV